MPGPSLVASTREVPLGAHALSLYSSPGEARDQAVSFLEGAPAGQPALFWVADAETAGRYERAAGERDLEHVGCVAILPGEQVSPEGALLRPVRPVREFLKAHPDGVTAGADTISRYWSPATMAAHLEYETWFQEQPRNGSRFVCPYDLATVPPEMAAAVLRHLGSHHTHVVLSASDEPGVRLLQLFVFGNAGDIPERLEGTLGWAVKNALVAVDAGTSEFELTSKGDAVVRDWAARPSERGPSRDGPEPPARSRRRRGTGSRRG